MKKIILNILSVLIFLPFIAFASYNIETFEPSAIPEVAIFDKDGNKHFLEEFEGKVVILSFWATWCASCIKEIPDLDVLQKDFKKLPLKIIPVSVDYRGIAPVLDFIKTHELRFLEPYHDFRNQLFNSMNVVGLPTSFIINPDGKMVARISGEVNWYSNELRDLLSSYLPHNNQAPALTLPDNGLNSKAKKAPKSSQPSAPKPEEKKNESNNKEPNLPTSNDKDQGQKVNDKPINEPKEQKSEESNKSENINKNLQQTEPGAEESKQLPEEPKKQKGLII